MIPLLERIKLEIKEALHNFGHYTFEDKGPDEVMDIGALEAELRKCTPEMVALVLTELAKGTEYEDMTARSLVSGLDDWDELFQQPGIPELYD